MRKFMILCLIGIVAAVDYNSEPQDGYTYSLDQRELVQPETVSPETEFYTFDAPDNFDDNRNDVQRLSSIVRPQRVVFIRTPEKNIFSITAEQLAKKDSLNIFLLSRQTNSEGLLSQLDEIRQKIGQKPNVQFVKYRTAEDIQRAKEAIYNDFESIPGSSQYYEDTKTPVFNFDSSLQQFKQSSGEAIALNPVIFKIIRRRHADSEQQLVDTYRNDDEEEEYQQYLPPSIE